MFISSGRSFYTATFGKIKRMIYFKFYKRRTDYPMDIFILKKKCMFHQMAGLHAYETSSLKELQKMDENFR
jgi:hypothetical protein